MNRASPTASPFVTHLALPFRIEINFRWANPVKIRSCKYLNNIVE